MTVFTGHEREEFGCRVDDGLVSHGAGANLFKAIVDGADLNGANLRGVRFLQCPQLKSAHNWQSTYRDEDLACGAAIPSR